MTKFIIYSECNLWDRSVILTNFSSLLIFSLEDNAIGALSNCAKDVVLVHFCDKNYYYYYFTIIKQIKLKNFPLRIPN